MDIEELKKALKSGEGKTLVEELIDSATKGLKEKNADLLTKLTDQKEKQKETDKRLEAIEKAKDEAETEAATKSGDVEKITKQLTDKHTKELTKVVDEKDALLKQLNVHVVDGSLSQALAKAGIAPQFMEAATALIKTAQKAEIADVDGKPIAKFGGKAVSDFVSEWAKSDAGKHFVSAGFNSGGGSNGANGSGSATSGSKSMTHDEFRALPATEQSKLSIAGIKLT